MSKMHVIMAACSPNEDIGSKLGRINPPHSARNASSLLEALICAITSLYILLYGCINNALFLLRFDLISWLNLFSLKRRSLSDNG